MNVWRILGGLALFAAVAIGWVLSSALDWPPI